MDEILLIGRPKKSLFLLLSIGAALLWWLFFKPDIETRFLHNEESFQQAADAYINDTKYFGENYWLRTMPPGEGSPYLGFHMGNDFSKDYYAPRIVYIHNDITAGVSTCSFDGRTIKKIKPHWYICKESRF